MVPSNVPSPVLIILIPIEIIGMFVKPFALTMRLGANMTAGHIGMVAIFALPIILGNGIQDPNNLNYNSNAIKDNGSCVSSTIEEIITSDIDNPWATPIEPVTFKLPKTLASLFI